MVPIETKAAIAMCGTFGYELDATALSKEEIETCRRMSELYHKYYDVNFFGDYYRLTNPYEPVNLVAWESVSKDKREALVTVITVSLTLALLKRSCKGGCPFVCLIRLPVTVEGVYLVQGNCGVFISPLGLAAAYIYGGCYDHHYRRKQCRSGQQALFHLSPTSSI